MRGTARAPRGGRVEWRGKGTRGGGKGMGQGDGARWRRGDGARWRLTDGELYERVDDAEK